MERLASLDPEALRRYPDAGALEARLAEGLDVEAERVLVTAGGDEALDRLCRARLGADRELLTTTPSFEMLPRYARLAGADVVEVSWMRGAFPTEEVVARVSPDTALVAVVSPNNPTGAVARREDLRRLSEAVPDALVLADLAYTEFAQGDLTGPALELPNVVVVRSLSKAWGLAGLRVGYAVGPTQVIEEMRGAGGPYSVSGISVAMAAERIADGGADVEAYVDRVRRERTDLEMTLTELGACPLPSEANFVLVRFGDAEGAWRRLADRGIAVRYFGNRPELKGYLRITCPGEAGAYGRLVSALGEVLA